MWTKSGGYMGHLAILTQMKVIQNLKLTMTVLKISKSKTFAPKMHVQYLAKEIKSKKGARFETANCRFLAHPLTYLTAWKVIKLNASKNYQ